MIDLNSNIAKEIEDNILFDDDYYPNLSKKCYESFMQSNAREQERLIVEHSLDVDCGYLFADDIDTTIKYLKELKEKGFTRIEERWYGYEDNYFVAIKMEQENDEEYVDRIAHTIKEIIHKEEIRIDNERAKQKKIKELEKQIQELKKS